MMKKTKNVTSGGPVLRLAFLIYCALMLWLLFGQRLHTGLQDSQLIQLGLNINLTPLHTLRQYWGLLLSDNAYYVCHAVVNLVGNVVMFVPMGLFFPWIWPSLRRVWRMVLFTLVLLVLIEFTQYLTSLGSCDVDDLILNFPGVMFGYCFWYIGYALKRSA